MKLISISDHSDWLVNERISIVENWLLHRDRVEFGKQTLNISMFVPAKLVNGEWVVLEEPKKASYDLTYPYDFNLYSEDIEEYETAKSNVLFEGFEIERDSFINDPKELYIKKDKIKFGWNYNNTNWNFYFKTIEDLVKYELTLTTIEKKQIGL